MNNQDIEWDKDELVKITSFIAGIVGQYGKPWALLSEIQQFTLKDEVYVVAKELLFMAQEKIKKERTLLLGEVNWLLDCEEDGLETNGLDSGVVKNIRKRIDGHFGQKSSLEDVGGGK